MRRKMYQIAEQIAKMNHCLAIVNGESVGQVASQTLSSMNAINEVIKIPVIRPLACFDKLEIIDIANKINTYNISILPYEDCCTIFVPLHPVINPDKLKCAEYEKLINYEELIYEAVKNMETINITEDNNNYKDLL
jgi:thiamine biosynthesis protein ThiI